MITTFLCDVHDRIEYVYGTTETINMKPIVIFLAYPGNVCVNAHNRAKPQHK